MSKIVHKNSTLSIFFSLSLPDNTLVDGTEIDTPFQLTLGQGAMIEVFEEVMLGMQEGETRKVRLPPRETFGFPEEHLKDWMPRNKFDFLKEQDIQLGAGLIMEFDTPNGDKIPGVILEVEDDRVLVDLNHPLAGRELTFEVVCKEVHD